MFDKHYNVTFPQEEIWKEVKGFSGFYEVSNYGRVRSLDRYIQYICKGVNVCRLKKGLILKPKYDKDGYESYVLYKEGGRHHLRGHRIVAENFIPNPDNLPVVDHKDGNVINNHTSNLQWMTSEQNTIKYYTQEANLGKSLSSLTREEWLYIGFLYNEGLTYQAIVDNLGLDIKSPDTIWAGLSGDRLQSITGFKKGDFKIRQHPTTKLSLEDALEIIKCNKILNHSQKELSEEWGVSIGTISRICNGVRQPEALRLFNEGIK